MEAFLVCPNPRCVGTPVFLFVRVEGDRRFFLLLFQTAGFVLLVIRLPLCTFFLLALMLLAGRSGGGEVNRIRTGSSRWGGERFRSSLGPVLQICHLFRVENRNWLLQQRIRSGGRRSHEVGAASWGGGGAGPCSGRYYRFRLDSDRMEKRTQLLQGLLHLQTIIHHTPHHFDARVGGRLL